MQDIIEQLQRYLKGIWNYRWYAMFIAWLICIVGWVHVYQMPNQYQSKAKIYIDTQSLLKPLLRGMAVETNTGHEINLMVKTLLTRPNVEKIIRLADLDLSVNNDREMTALVRKLQKKIKFKTPSRRGINIYDLEYSSSSPMVAQKVLQSVITVFIENSIGQNKDDSSSAKNFIDKQIVEYEKRLLKSENRLKMFKKQNMGSMPGSGGGYYSRMQATKTSISQVKLQLKETNQSKQALNQELKNLVASIKASSLSNEANSLIKTSYDARIERLNLNLDALLLRYTPNHPDVKAIERTLADLDVKRLLELKVLSESEGDALKLNPVYQSLKISIGELNSTIGALTVRLAEYKKRYSNLALLADHSLEVETQLKALNRDYSVTKSKYTQLLNSRETATLSQSISNTADGVQFNVIEAPRIALTPSGPNRILLSGAVLLLSLCAGIALALLLSLIRPVFSSVKELEDILGLPILGTVSSVVSPGQRKRRTMLALSYMSLLLMLFLAYALLMAWYMEGFWKMIDNVLKL